MQRVTISLDEELGAAFDQLMSARGYTSRSEAIRDLLREAVSEAALEAGSQDNHCVAALSYVYNHQIRSLGQRLVELHHDHHKLIMATTQVFLDQASCLETVILKGDVAEVSFYADMMRAERGVSYAKINLIHLDGDHAQHLSPKLS